MRTKKIKILCKMPLVLFVTGSGDPPPLDVDVIKLLCYIYVLFCFYGRNMFTECNLLSVI